MKRYGHEKFETLLRESTVHAARAPLAQRRLASVRRCCVWRRRFSLFCRIRGAALCARRFKRRSARGARLPRASPWPRSIHRPCAARRTAERPGPTASACAPSRLRVGLSGPCRACVAAAAPAAALSERICPRFEQGKSLISDSDKQRIFQRLGQEKTALGSDYTQRRRRRRRADCGGRGEGGKGGGGGGGVGGGGGRRTVASRRGTLIGVTPLYGAREAPRDGEASAAACRGPVYAHAVGRGPACAPTKSADVIDSAPPPRAASALITAHQRGGACLAP